MTRSSSRSQTRLPKLRWPQLSALVSIFVFGALVLLRGACVNSETDASVDSFQAPKAGITTAITAANVYEHEKDWPAIVALTQEWTPPGEERVLQKGYQGALVRVTAEGDPRIDFGRHGKHVVPSYRTDLVEAANAVREGRAFKGGPNFLRQIGTRLVDSESDVMRPVKSVDVAGFDAYLCVFADPTTEEFRTLAGRLSRATADTNIQSILFPQSLGREDLHVVKERLGAAEWRVPFAYPHLSEDYTQSILGLDAKTPALLLVSPEGRILYSASLDEDVDLDGIRAAVES